MRRVCAILIIAAATECLPPVNAHADVIFDRQRGAVGVATLGITFSHSGGSGRRDFGSTSVPDPMGVLELMGSGAFEGVVGESFHDSETDFSHGVLSVSGSGSTSANALGLPGNPEEHFDRHNRGLTLTMYQLDFEVLGEPTPYSLESAMSKSATVFAPDSNVANNFGSLQTLLQVRGGGNNVIHNLRLDRDGPNMGSISPTGMLDPGLYRLIISAQASSSFSELIQTTGGLATAQYNFSFSVGEPTPHIHWIQGNGSFRTADNWNTAEMPDVQSVAIFDLNQIYTVDLGGVETVIDRAFFHQGLVALDNGTLRLRNPSAQTPSLMVGVAPGEVAAIQFLAGSALGTVNAVVGAAAGSKGTVSFDDVGTWLNTGSLVIGRGGRGEMLLDRTGGHAAAGELIVGKDITGAGKVDVTTGSAADGPGVTTGKAVIGAEGFGELFVRTGGLVRTTATAELGSLGPNSHGLVFVDGRSVAGNRRSTWEVSDTLSIGVMGQGELDITGGGVVSGSTAVLAFAAGSRGSVLVEGNPGGNSPSSWINTENVIVGFDGSADVRVLDGGIVVSENATVAGEAGAQGVVTISGVTAGSSPPSPSQWSALGEFVVGRGGSGELQVENGGKLQSIGGKIGELGTPSAIGIATVRGMHAPSRTRSQWEVSQLLEVGVAGRGLLQVFEGGVVTTADAIVGGQSGFGGSTGTITVRGAAPGGAGDISALFVENHLSVGLTTGTGFVNVEAGGAMQTGTAAIGGLAGSTGAVEVRGADTATGIGSQWLNIGDLNVGVIGAGTLTIAGDGRVAAGFVRVGPNGVIRGDGTLVVPGTSRLVENGGVIEPGLSPGTLTIEGNYVQTAGGRLEIEVTGKDAGQFDVLNVTGNATLGGRLRLEFIDGFAPRQGDMIEFLDVAGTVANSFANVELRNLAPEFQFEVRSIGGAMTMVALNDGVFVPPPPSNWNVDAGGNWSSAANWTGEVPDAAGAVAVFGNKITAPRTVTVDVPVTLGRIDFASAHAYTIGGTRAITLHANSIAEEINVNGGSHTIAAPVVLADDTLITVAPAASNLSLTGTLTASGIDLTKAGAGTLTMNNLRAASLSINAGTVAMVPGGTDASASVLGALTIPGGGTPTAKLDINDSAAIVNYAGTSPAATMRAQILAGRVEPGFGGTWAGPGITSNAAAADPVSRSVGYAENSALPLGPYTTFRGEAVDDTSILMAFTRTGDANLDGLVNDDDVTILGATYAPGVPQPSWALGDFDYNGFVDDDDVTLLGVFYDPSAPPLAAAAAVSPFAAVPEPATATLLSVTLTGWACAILRRRLNPMRRIRPTSR
jgi:T5SS/PEP-CTERM-associated repeat protein